MNKTMTACPLCHSLNRVDTQKAINKQATCGKCGKTLNLDGLVSDVSGEDMLRIINKADVPVIVDFWASWCGPCQMYGPEFEKASLQNQNAIFLKVNTESNPQISTQLGIRGIPATIVFKNGKEYRRQAGAIPSHAIGDLIK